MVGVWSVHIWTFLCTRDTPTGEVTVILLKQNNKKVSALDLEYKVHIFTRHTNDRHFKFHSLKIRCWGEKGKRTQRKRRHLYKRRVKSRRSLIAALRKTGRGRGTHAQAIDPCLIWAVGKHSITGQIPANTRKLWTFLTFEKISQLSNI